MNASERIRYAKERPNYVLYVSGRPIGLGELPVYHSLEHAEAAATQLGLAVPINILQTHRLKAEVQFTVQPTPALIRKDAPQSIWEMYLLGWHLTLIKLECSYLDGESYLYVQVDKPGRGFMDKIEPFLPTGSKEERFGLWVWFHDWAKISANTLTDSSWVLRTPEGESRGDLRFR